MKNQYCLSAVVVLVSIGLSMVNILCPWFISTVIVGLGIFSAYGVFRLLDD